jgi:hypothetical protein
MFGAYRNMKERYTMRISLALIALAVGGCAVNSERITYQLSFPKAAGQLVFDDRAKIVVISKGRFSRKDAIKMALGLRPDGGVASILLCRDLQKRCDMELYDSDILILDDAENALKMLAEKGARPSAVYIIDPTEKLVLVHVNLPVGVVLCNGVERSEAYRSWQDWAMSNRVPIASSASRDSVSLLSSIVKVQEQMGPRYYGSTPGP